MSDLADIPGARDPGPWRSGTARFRASIVAALVIVVLVIAFATSAHAAARPAGRCPQWETLIARYELPVATFSRIMHRESGCQPAAYNRRTGDTGLLQLNPVVWRDQRGWVRALRARCGATSRAAAFQPAVNVCVAAGLHDHLGIQPWL